MRERVMYNRRVALKIKAISILFLFPLFSAPIFSQACPVFVGEWTLPTTINIKEPFLGAFAEDNRYISRVALDLDVALIVAISHAEGAYRSDIYVIDISIPSNPVQRSQIVIDTLVGDLTIRNGLAFIVAGKSNVWIFDLIDRANPKQIGFWGDESSNWSEKVLLDEELLFLIGRDLAIVNISNPASPVLVGRWRGNLLGKDAVRFGNYLFMARVDPGLISFINIIDIADPSAPFLAAQTWTSQESYPEALAIYGHYLFASPAHSGLAVFDISDPLHPVEMMDVPIGSGQHLVLRGGTLYSSGYGVDVIKVNDPLHPTRISYYRLDWGIDLDVKNDILAYSTLDNAAFLDVSGCTHPRPIKKP